MKFPKYDRENKIGNKISNKDLEKMINLRKEGLSYSKISKLFNVCPDTAWFNINKIIAPEKLELRRIRNLSYWKSNKDKEKIKIIAKKYSSRKRINQKELLNTYYKILMRNFRKKTSTHR